LLNKPVPISTDAKEQERIPKWDKMLQQLEQNEKPAKLKARTRKGVPDSIRARAWPLYTHIRKITNGEVE